MKNGWIKLHRKIEEKGYYKKPHYLALWIHLLLRASHKENEFVWNDKIIKVKKGQLLTGRKKLSKQIGIKPTTTERILKLFENEQQIGQQKTTKWRLITIYNYDKYQIVDSVVGNKRTTDGQQTDTNKKNKNVKKDIHSPLAREISDYFVKQVKKIKSVDYMFNKGKDGAAIKGFRSKEKAPPYKQIIDFYLNHEKSDRFLSISSCLSVDTINQFNLKNTNSVQNIWKSL